MVGHRGGIATSVEISRSYRRDHRPSSQFVEPQQVLDVIRVAGVRRWVLMGLYGYVGYLTEPRATQAVDVLVDFDELDLAIDAIVARWPALQVDRQVVVVRFLDPGEIAITGEMKQVIDLMLPDDDCYHEILQHAHRVDPPTGDIIPTLEAACASKFAALISPNRQFIKKQQDAVDLRRLFVPNQCSIDRFELERLGELVYPGGGHEILEFLDLAIEEKPFPTRQLASTLDGSAITTNTKLTTNSLPPVVHRL
ncbi:MAG: hypothetical protein AAF664_19080 [Planctomycetota bacterium]